MKSIKQKEEKLAKCKRSKQKEEKLAK